ARISPPNPNCVKVDASLVCQPRFPPGGDWRRRRIGAISDLLEVRISSELPAERPVVLVPRYAQYEHNMLRVSNAREASMPIIESFGPSASIASPQPAAGRSVNARKLPAPQNLPLEWNEEVARETAHLYERV